MYEWKWVKLREWIFQQKGNMELNSRNSTEILSNKIREIFYHEEYPSKEGDPMNMVPQIHKQYESSFNKSTISRP